jgi:hypothetical protein
MHMMKSESRTWVFFATNTSSAWYSIHLARLWFTAYTMQENVCLKKKKSFEEQKNRDASTELQCNLHVQPLTLGLSPSKLLHINQWNMDHVSPNRITTATVEHGGCACRRASPQSVPSGLNPSVGALLQSLFLGCFSLFLRSYYT